ncbi:hypothetical protein [Aquibacillus rhizosphaerae]|uniref:Uncharacterized protein n=1 Tax=Aquibacillus rhizosphaerae TaxID=3051431 RepID=A0ABT7L6P6_9BACI|nr:hypothetical protein [Aquibacillus sp. LR5S19]MDL4841516.1 hypothetical protein [Aquibacillus sp. LR5S19]
MSDDRTKIIIKEINYWKQYKMLPTEYCDFLLALYTEGESVSEKQEDVISIKEKLFHIFVYFSNFLILPLIFLIIYFTELKFILQMLLVFIFMTISLYYYRFFKKKAELNEVFSLVLLLLNSFLVSVHIMKVFFDSFWITNIIVIVNCLIWIWIGYSIKIKFMIISGIIGMLLLIIYYFI